jgi:two-component system, OmpR family, phosphate regulon sensor histidine kinase PhoR
MSTTLLIFALSVVVLVLAWRQWALIGMIREFCESVEAKRTFLIERRGHLARVFHLVPLQKAFNRLIAENQQSRREDKGLLQVIEIALGSIRESILVIDENNYVRMGNEALRQLLNMDDNIVGKRLEAILQSADFLEYVRAIKTDHIAASEVIEFVWNEEIFYFEVTGSRLPRLDPASETQLTLFVLHDITRQTKLEKIRTEFVANVSHELRTPVTIIKGFTETLIEDVAELTVEEQSRFLNKIQKNVLRLHRLLEDLLTLSRLESRNESPNRQNVSIQNLLQDICENFEDRLSDEQTIELHRSPGNDLLQVDPLRLTQVVENLLDNILRHAKGFKKISIHCDFLKDGLRVNVADDGCGVPPRDLPHLFDRFYRVDKGRSRESGGTGLGLSIVKHIVQQHSGQITAQSDEGKGTTVSFFLPRTEDTDSSDPHGKTATPGKWPSSRMRQKPLEVGRDE